MNPIFLNIFSKNHGSVTSLVSEISDDGIYPIGLYLESIVEGSRFLEISKNNKTRSNFCNKAR